METLDKLKEKLSGFDNWFLEKYMRETVIDAERQRAEAYANWLPLPVKIWKKLNPDYEINPHNLTVPLPDFLYHAMYVKSFKATELRVVAETFQKYTASNAEITLSLTELHNYRGFSPFKRKLFYDASQLMASEGLPLNEALSTVCKGLMDEKLILSIKIGMESNTLSESIASYLEDLEFDMKNNSRIKKALAYPIMIVIMILAICVAGKLMFLPQLFEPMGIDMDNLPSETGPMITVANIVLNPISLIEIFVGFKVITFLYRNSVSLATIVDIILLRIPVVGEYVIAKNVCFFFRNLHSYVNAGNTTIDAHIKACETLGLPTLRIIFESKKKGILEGETLSEAYNNITFIKEDIKMILGVAEKNGALSEALYTCTEMLKTSYQETTDNLVSKIPTYSTLASGVAIAVLLLPLLSILYNLDKFIT